MKYLIVTAQVVVRVAPGRTNAFAEQYSAQALADKRDVVLILKTESRELTAEEYAHIRAEVPED